KNIHVRAEEYEGNVVFLHQIQEGAADKSYGIQVAKLADLPDALISRANSILQTLENHEHEMPKEPANEPVDPRQLSFFAEENTVERKNKYKKTKSESTVLQELTNLDLFDMTPLDTMNTLHQLQKRAKKRYE